MAQISNHLKQASKLRCSSFRAEDEEQYQCLGICHICSVPDEGELQIIDGGHEVSRRLDVVVHELE